MMLIGNVSAKFWGFNLMADNQSSTGTWPPVELIVRRIYLIRSLRVMLATPNSTKCLNEALKRGLASEPAATGRPLLTR
jgi:hypothetical protein